MVYTLYISHLIHVYISSRIMHTAVYPQHKNSRSRTFFFYFEANAALKRL